MYFQYYVLESKICFWLNVEQWIDLNISYKNGNRLIKLNIDYYVIYYILWCEIESHLC